MKQPPFPMTHDSILCMPCCCEVLGKGIEMSETINFHSEVHRQYKVRDVGPNCLCELPQAVEATYLKDWSDMEYCTYFNWKLVKLTSSPSLIRSFFKTYHQKIWALLKISSNPPCLARQPWLSGWVWPSQASVEAEVPWTKHSGTWKHISGMMFGEI